MVSRAKPLGLLGLVALIFYDVSGGPFGIEVGGGRGRVAVQAFVVGHGVGGYKGSCDMSAGPLGVEMGCGRGRVWCGAVGARSALLS